MQIDCWFLGGKHDKDIAPLISHYTKKIKHYHHKIHFSILEEDKKSKTDPKQLQQKNATTLLQKLPPSSYLILLDEKGKLLTSVDLSYQLDKWIQLPQTCVFCVGGAYGFHDDLRKRANFIWSLSPLTFPHQLARLFLVEQLYRSFSILHNIPYHHV